MNAVQHIELIQNQAFAARFLLLDQYFAQIEHQQVGIVTVTRTTLKWSSRDSRSLVQANTQMKHTHTGARTHACTHMRTQTHTQARMPARRGTGHLNQTTNKSDKSDK